MCIEALKCVLRTDDDIRNAGALGEDSVRVAPSLPAALELLEKEYTPAEIHQVFVIGGYFNIAPHMFAS